MRQLIMKEIGRIDNTYIGIDKYEDTRIVITNDNDVCFLKLSTLGELYPSNYLFSSGYSEYAKYVLEMLLEYDVEDDIVNELILGKTKFDDQGYTFPWRHDYRENAK